MKKFEHSVFHIFSTVPIKHRLLITYLFLSSFILVITAVSFYKTSKNALVEHATLSSQQQLIIITNNLSEKIGHISDYAITLSINSDIGETLKENPTVPENALSRFFVNSALTKQAQRIIGLHKNISNWDILDTENQWFHSSTDITEELTPYLSPEFLRTLNRSPSSRQLKKYKFFLPVEIYLLAVFMQLASKFRVFPLALKFRDSFASVYCCSNLYNLRSFLREYLYQ